MAKEEKTNLYLLSIVAIVAIVGIVVLILNSGTGSVSLSADDLSGEAYKISSAKTTLKPGLLYNSVQCREGGIECSQCCKDGSCLPCSDSLAITR